jgi:hypothetical protein
MSRTGLVFCAAVAWTLCGCGEPPTGNPVTGRVTFQGQPLDQGSIEFSPAAGQGTVSGGMIRDGQYTIPADSGLEPGLYHVRILSTEGPASRTDEMPGEVKTPPKQRIPVEYNSETTLQAEIKAAGENKFDFAIP